MADKQTQALKRLTKKLNALRKTLRKDERDILDQLVLGEAGAEVAAHKFSTKAATKASEVAAHKFGTKASSKASNAVVEVAAHKMATSSRPAVSYDAGTGNYIVVEGAEPEVAAHSLVTGAATAAKPIAATVLKEKAAT